MRCWKTILSSASSSCRRAKIRIHLFVAKGRKQFEERVASARDFFDYWIEREIASTRLDFAWAQRVQAARNLATTVSRVHDPVLRGRGGQQSIGAPRCCAGGFRITAGKARSSTRWFRELDAQLKFVPRRVHRMTLLCFACWRCAMQTPAIFCTTQNWREILEQVPETEILIRILESELDPNDTGVAERVHGYPFPRGGTARFLMADAKDAHGHRNSGREVVAGDLPECCASSFGDGKKPDQSSLG